VFILTIFLFILALILLWLARARQKASGLPGGRIIYSDTQHWKPVEKPLYDPDLGLTGRPDYLIEKDNQVIPVEVKSSRAPDAPYDSHIFQVAAYCRLVHITFGKRPPYGILHYPNRTFAIDFTAELEMALINLLDEMRTQDRLREVDRSHDSASRCQGCGYRAVCGQKLS
jgi:CRISPR-associated exonuclease Cas4